jgi:hypothetical protein
MRSVSPEGNAAAKDIHLLRPEGAVHAIKHSSEGHVRLVLFMPALWQPAVAFTPALASYCTYVTCCRGVPSASKPGLRPAVSW